MRYFQIAGNPLTFGYDETDPSQLAAMEAKFFTAGVLNSGVTEVTGNWPPAPTLAQTRIAQLSSLAQSYATAIQTPMSYTSKGGVTKTFQADSGSISSLQNTVLGFQAAGATPAGFYWVSADNTQVPFTYADLQGLASAMVAQGWTAFQHLQTQKAAVNTIVNLPARAANTSYTTGTQIVDGNGNVWSCTTAGKTGMTVTFPATPTAGTTKTDGGVTWAYENAQVAMIQSIVW